jgi:uncharacterized protein HemY
VGTLYDFGKSYPHIDDIMKYLKTPDYATQYLQRGEYAKAKDSVYKLLDLTPGRRDSVRLAAQYSLKANDKKMQAILAKQGIKLGIVTEQR